MRKVESAHNYWTPSQDLLLLRTTICFEREKHTEPIHFQIERQVQTTGVNGMETCGIHLPSEAIFLLLVLTQHCSLRGVRLSYPSCIGEYCLKCVLNCAKLENHSDMVQQVLYHHHYKVVSTGPKRPLPSEATLRRAQKSEQKKLLLQCGRVAKG